MISILCKCCSALPGGSITGAPKIRAMQIIEELEESARGAYCGTLGYFNFDGTGRWNILIRSFQQYQNQLFFMGGGGITIASNAEAEYQESLDKVSYAELDEQHSRVKLRISSFNVCTKRSFCSSVPTVIRKN